MVLFANHAQSRHVAHRPPSTQNIPTLLSSQGLLIVGTCVGAAVIGTGVGRAVIGAGEGRAVLMIGAGVGRMDGGPVTGAGVGEEEGRGITEGLELGNGEGDRVL